MRAKVAACVNIWPIESIYWWEGELKEDIEAVLIIKTNEAKMAEIIEKRLSIVSNAIIRIIRRLFK
jgi:periplasmic divalent cation tolerance protein